MLTTILACYAALTSTASVTLSILLFRLNGHRVRASASWDPHNFAITLTVWNAGRSDVTVEPTSTIFVGPDEVYSIWINWQGPSPQARLQAGSAEHWYGDGTDLAKDLLEKDQRCTGVYAGFIIGGHRVIEVPIEWPKLWGKNNEFFRMRVDEDGYHEIIKLPIDMKSLSPERDIFNDPLVSKDQPKYKNHP